MKLIIKTSPLRYFETILRGSPRNYWYVFIIHGRKRPRLTK